MNDLNGHSLDLYRVLGGLETSSAMLLDHAREHRADMMEVKERLAVGNEVFRQHATVHRHLHGRITALEMRPQASKSPPHEDLPPGWEKVALRLGAALVAFMTAAGTGTLGEVARITDALVKLSEHAK